METGLGRDVGAREDEAFPVLSDAIVRSGSSISVGLSAAGSLVHVPTSEWLRCKGADLFWAASMKTLSGSRSPTNRDVDNSISWEATISAEAAASFWSVGEDVCSTPYVDGGFRCLVGAAMD